MMHNVPNQGQVSLIDAARNGDMFNVQNLLNNGADVNQIDNRGQTALILAAREGHVNIVTHLLSVGADVTQADNRGQTALMLAAREGYVNIVTHLLSVGADVTQADEEGRIALHFAVYYRREEIVVALLGMLPDMQVNVQNLTKGQTPLHLAVWRASLAVVQLLVEAGAEIDMRDNELKTVYDYAKINKNNQAIQDFLGQ